MNDENMSKLVSSELTEIEKIADGIKSDELKVTISQMTNMATSGFASSVLTVMLSARFISNPLALILLGQVAGAGGAYGCYKLDKLANGQSRINSSNEKEERIKLLSKGMYFTLIEEGFNKKEVKTFIENYIRGMGIDLDWGEKETINRVEEKINIDDDVSFQSLFF